MASPSSSSSSTKKGYVPPVWFDASPFQTKANPTQATLTRIRDASNKMEKLAIEGALKTTQAELEALLKENDEVHMTVQVPGVLCPCEPTRQKKCQHTRSHFQGTRNSKRMVQIWLWLKYVLNFKDIFISDQLLRKPVRASLQPCAQGWK